MSGSACHPLQAVELIVTPSGHWGNCRDCSGSRRTAGLVAVMLRLDFLARDACAHRARLRERGLAQHEQAFRKNNIVPEILPKLTAEWRADVLARINDHPAAPRRRSPVELAHPPVPAAF